MTTETVPYRDISLSIDDRVRDLVGRMTVDEKIAQLAGINAPSIMEADAFSIEKAAKMLEHGIGEISRLAASNVLGPGENAVIANEIQRYLLEHTRLAVPAIIHEESVAGYTAKGATCFPQAIGLAATFSPELIESMADAIRRQMLAAGARQTLAPVLDIARDARWGRCEETYGEDPYLAARLGVAYVRGMQTDDLRDGIACTGKHFLGYGASEGGLNWAPTHIPPRELREVFAAPFEAAIREANLNSIMNSYAEIDGEPCGGSRATLTDLLRGELGFTGAVVADYFTVRMLMQYHHIAGSKAAAAATALNAGLDIELPGFDCFRSLHKALEEGLTDEATLDVAVGRSLRRKFELGIFEQPYIDAAATAAAFDTSDDRALARTIAEQSIVLLTNDGVLPLDEGVLRIAVIGPHADSARLLQGDYHYPSHIEMLFGAMREDGQLATGEVTNFELAPGGEARERVDLRQHFVPHVTPLEGIRSRLPAAEISYARGCGVIDPDTGGFAEAVAAARAAEVALVFVGERSGLVEGCTSGESSDRADISLPGVQQQLVEAVVATGTPTVIVLINGRPLAIPWIAEHANAVVEAWAPGEEGGNAIASILLGDVNPGGRLPMTFPRSSAQLPMFYNHKPSGGRSQWRVNYTDMATSPLFAFGHGLSYTRFEYGELSLDSADVPANGSLNISVPITNAGDRAGDEVVQLYIRDIVASTTRPLRQLAGFVRVPLAAGETRTVTFALDMTQLALYDPAMRLVVEPGEVEVLVGASSADIRSRATFNITGETRELSRAGILPTAVSIN